MAPHRSANPRSPATTCASAASPKQLPDFPHLVRCVRNQRTYRLLPSPMLLVQIRDTTHHVRGQAAHLAAKRIDHLPDDLVERLALRGRVRVDGIDLPAHQRQLVDD